MYRLAILTRLRRRIPIQIAKEAISPDLAYVNELPDSPFIDSEGRFQWLELARPPLISTLARYCTPAVHPSVIGAASGNRLKVVTELLDTNANDNNRLERAEAMYLLACQCREGYARPDADTAELSEFEMATFAESRLSSVFSNASAISDSAVDASNRPALQLMELNWLGFSIATVGLPSSCLALYRLLRSLGAPDRSAVAVLEPGISYMANLLGNKNEAPWQSLQAWLLATLGEDGPDPAATRHVQEISAGLDCLLLAAEVFRQNLEEHESKLLRDFVARSRFWMARATEAFAEVGLPFRWPAQEQMSQRLEQLEHRIKAVSATPLPGYFGFPLNGKLPLIRVHERLGTQYVGKRMSPFFQGSCFSFDAFLAAATTSFDQLLSDDPELMRMVADAGGDDADFHALSEALHDQIDALSVANPDAEWNEARSILFLRALSCRALAVLRNQSWPSTNDLYGVLKGYASSEEQRVGVAPAAALLLFAPLIAVIDAASCVMPEDSCIEAVRWVRQFQSSRPDEQAYGRARLQQLHFAWKSLCCLLEDGKDVLVDLAGTNGQEELQWRVADMVDDLQFLADVPGLGILIAHDQNDCQSFLPQAERRYRKAAEERFSQGKNARSRPDIGIASEVPESGAVRRLGSESTTSSEIRVQVIDAEVMNNYADSRFIKDNWSVKKAEQIRNGVLLLPAMIEAVSQLRDEFPWFINVVDFVELWLARNAALGITSCQLPPLLLLGGYGCGKTHFGRRLAELQQLPFRLLPAGGSSDNRQLAGTSRGWGTAFPSLPTEFMASTGVGNGLLMVDEIDKESSDRRNGRMSDTLLQLLEPANAKVFEDPFLGCPVNCVHLQWILTANSTSGISRALLSRVRVFAVQQPRRMHYPRLAQQIRLGFARENQVDHRLLPPLDADDLNTIQKNCRSAREVRQITEWILTKKIVDERGEAIVN